MADRLLSPHGFESPRSRATTLWYQQQSTAEPTAGVFKTGKEEDEHDPASAKAKSARVAQFREVWMPSSRKTR